MESLEEVAAREEAERQQSLRDLEQLYEWLQQFEDPPPAPRPPPPHQFRNGMFVRIVSDCENVGKLLNCSAVQGVPFYLSSLSVNIVGCGLLEALSERCCKQNFDNPLVF